MRKTPEPGDWDGILFDDTEDNAILDYCIIEYAKTGIKISSTLNAPYAISCPNEDNFTSVENCIIRYNEFDGINVTSGTYDVGFCTSTPYPDAIPTIKNNIIHNNGNHGIYLLAGNRSRNKSVITNNVIYKNNGDGVNTDLVGGSSLEPIIKNNTIVDNQINGVKFSGAVDDTLFEISNNIIIRNSFGIFSLDEGKPKGGYNNVWNNIVNYQGIGTLEEDIASDPLFLDPLNYNFELSNSSPCIDAGNPDSPKDPDSTRADIGAFYFDKTFFADFEAGVKIGTVPFSVSFIENVNLGNGQEVKNWFWEFGDGQTSNEKSPVHIYTSKGQFDVSLTISNEVFSNKITKEAFIKVLNSPPQVVVENRPISFDEDTKFNQLNLYSIFRDPDKDSLIFSATSTQHMVIDIKGDGSVLVTPDPNWSGSETTLFEVNDNDGGINRFEQEFIVRPVNDPPNIVSISPADTFLMVDQEKVSFEVIAEDVDNALGFTWLVNEEVLDSSNVNNFDFIFENTGDYTIKCKISDGTEKISVTWVLRVLSSIHNLPKGKIEDFMVYPNPFHNSIQVSFNLLQSSNISIFIHNNSAQKVKTFFQDQLVPDQYQLIWDGTSDSGELVSPGIYYVYFEMDNEFRGAFKVVKH